MESLSVYIAAPTDSVSRPTVRATLSRYVTNVTGRENAAANGTVSLHDPVCCLSRCRISVTAMNPDELEGVWIDLGLRANGSGSDVKGARALSILLQEGLVDAKLTWEDGVTEVIPGPPRSNLSFTVAAQYAPSGHANKVSFVQTGDVDDERIRRKVAGHGSLYSTCAMPPPTRHPGAPDRVSAGLAPLPVPVVRRVRRFTRGPDARAANHPSTDSADHNRSSRIRTFDGREERRPYGCADPDRRQRSQDRTGERRRERQAGQACHRRRYRGAREPDRFRPRTLW